MKKRDVPTPKSASDSRDHPLQQFVASLFIEQGCNPKRIQVLLGQAAITMTMYAFGQLFESAEEDVSMFKKLENDLLTA